MSASGNKHGFRALGALTILAVASTITGCGMGSGSAINTGTGSGGGITGASSKGLQGTIYGGQQPISGATIQLYAAGLDSTGASATSGYGAGSTALIASASYYPYAQGGGPGCVAVAGGQTCTALPTTDATGRFSVTGDYTCPTTADGSPSEVYIVASGGNPGLTGTINNTFIALMAAIGPCASGGNLTTATAATATFPAISAVNFVNINEVTTVAAVWALQQFIAPPTSASVTGVPAIGAPNTAYSNGLATPTIYRSANTGLRNAFTTASILSDISTGFTPNTNYRYATPSSQKIYTLANILAYCINSAGASGTACPTLAGDVNVANQAGTASLTAPTDTIQIAYYIAQNPTYGANTGTNAQNSSLTGGSQCSTNGTLYPLQAAAGAPFATGNSGAAAVGPCDWQITVNYLPTYSNAGVTTAGLGVPFSIGIDAFGNAWVDSTYLASLVSGGTTTPGEFPGAPQSTTLLSADGSILGGPYTTYTASTTGGAYSQITTAGTTPTTTRTYGTANGSNQGPRYLAVDLSNRAWVPYTSDATTGTVSATNPNFSSVGVFPAAVGSGAGSGSSTAVFGASTGTASGYFTGYEPYSVVADGKNNIYLSAYAGTSTTALDGGSVQRVNASTGAFTFSTSAATPTGLGTAVTYPSAILGGFTVLAYDSNANFTDGTNPGLLWVSEQGGCTNTTGQDGTTSTQYGYQGQFLSTLTTVLPGSDLASASAFPTTTTPPTNATRSTACSGASLAQFYGANTSTPYGIAIDANNGVWLGDNFQGAGFDGLTYLIAPTSQSTDTIPGSASFISQTIGAHGNAVYTPRGLIVDGYNHVWYANAFVNAYSIGEAAVSINSTTPTITLLTPNNTTTPVGFLSDGVRGATQVAIDPSGNVWATNNGTGTANLTFGSQAGTAWVEESVIVYVGAAGPVVSPLSLAIANNKLGARP